MNAISEIENFQRFGSILGLERISKLLEKLGNPERELKVVHVAGTNGKGSICRYIYEVLESAGYKVGIYTSPFIEKFNERIEFDHEYISDSELNSYTERVLAKVKELVSEGSDSPTEFEVITAIAFLYFKEKACDYVVLEVGLGGKGDSTNVVDDPLCSIIASISLDHTDRLGSTISEIAAEKAGIIKFGAPVVSSAKHIDAIKVISETAQSLGSEYIDSNQFEYVVTGDDIRGCSFDANVLGKEYKNIKLSMTGEYQIENAMCALTALTLMKNQGKIDFTDEELAEGMAKAKQPARFEIFGDKPMVIIDGAHNPDAARRLNETCKKYLSGKKILIIVGILADKAVDEVLDYFTEIGTYFIATEPENPRKLSCTDLAEKIEARGKKTMVCMDALLTVDYARNMSEEFDAIIYAGSLYMAGEVRKFVRLTWGR